jgi:hypothetical protein
MSHLSQPAFAILHKDVLAFCSLKLTEEGSYEKDIAMHDQSRHWAYLSSRCFSHGLG